MSMSGFNHNPGQVHQTCEQRERFSIRTAPFSPPGNGLAAELMLHFGVDPAVHTTVYRELADLLQEETYDLARELLAGRGLIQPNGLPVAAPAGAEGGEQCG